MCAMHFGLIKFTRQAKNSLYRCYYRQACFELVPCFPYQCFDSWILHHRQGRNSKRCVLHLHVLNFPGETSKYCLYACHCQILVGQMYCYHVLMKQVFKAHCLIWKIKEAVDQRLSLIIFDVIIGFRKEFNEKFLSGNVQTLFRC